MLPVGWLVLAVVVAVLLTVWVTFTLTRLDRLHARVDAAQAALDAQLVRRTVALLRIAESGANGFAAAERARVEAVARFALDGGFADQSGERGPGGEREAAENAVGREIAALAAQTWVPAESPELRESATRVLIARRFYNDAVRDTRALRARRMPRLLHLAGHRDLPEFFDIADTVPAAGNAPVSPSTEQDPA